MGERTAKLLGRPTQLWTAAAAASINLGVVFEVFDWTETQVAVANLAAGAIVALAANDWAAEE
jgi:hypothetical protein